MSIKKIFKPFKKPTYKYVFLCKRCDIFFDRIGHQQKYPNNKCPICGSSVEVYSAELVGDDE